MESEPIDVLERVRRALGRSSPLTTAPTPPDIPQHVARLVPTDVNLVDLFIKRAEENKMHPQNAGSNDVAQRIVTFLRDHNLKRVAAPVSPLLDRLGLPAAVRAAGIEYKTWNEITLDQLYDFDTGITDVTYAIAETGSLVIQSSAQHGRAISLVPMVHIAIVEPKNILPDLIDLMDNLVATGVGNNVSIITGPSKTADIEGALVVGVHGPGEVQVFVLQ